MSILRDVRQRNKGTRIYTFATNLPFREEKARKFLSLLATQNSGRFSDDRMGLPRGLALGADGHIYIADSTVKVFSNSGRHVRSFGPNTIKVAVANSGDVHLLFYQHIADSGFGALGICQADGTQLDCFAEYGFMPQQMDMPWGMAVDSQKRTYVTCTNLNKVIIFDSTGKFVRSFGSSGIRAHQVEAWRGDRLYPHEEHIRREGIRSSKCGFFAGPMDVAVDSDDNIFVLDSGNFRIQVFSSQIRFMREFPIHGSGIAMTFDRTGNYIYVLTGLMKHTGGDEICIYTSNGELAERFAIDAGTSDISVDSSGNIYALNFVDDRVNVFSSQGQKLRSFSTVQ
jgi:DNA-binding beta-propeller fold protein YncE